MLCDVCREESASVHLTKVVQGDVTLVHLCPKCAAERGIETTVTASPKTVLGEFLHAVQQDSSVTSDGEAMRCTFCQLSLADFRATGRLGCDRCYDTFGQNLRELLRRVHGSAKHAGRRYIPPVAEVFGRVSTQGELNDRLRRAIFNEEFELAASLRDKLKGME